LGNVFADQKRYQRAIDCYNTALERGSILDNQSVIERAYNGLGYTYYLMGNPEQAIAYAQRSMATFEKKTYSYNDANNLHTIGMAHLAMGNVEQAEKHLQLALSVAEENGYATNLAEFQEGLYTLYQQTGDYRRAFEYLQAYVTAKEKINGSVMNANINEVEAEFLAQERKLALEKMEAKNVADEERFKKTINYVSASLVAVSLILLVFFQRHKMVVARNQQQLTQNKYNSLRSQMNPHFIFNTINGVQNHILKADKLRAYQHLNRFADTLRLMLSNADQPFVKLSVERQLLEQYILLEQERFANRFCYQLRIDDALLDHNPLIPSMVLQPIVENAIIHGLSNKEGPGTLLVNIQRREKTVLCVIEDNGIGREAALRNKQARVNKHLSMATKNTHERIALLRKFGYERSRLTIEDLYDLHESACGTRVVVELPLKTTTND
jgi:tetratricopeptide (TPR) repeat protein